ARRARCSRAHRTTARRSSWSSAIRESPRISAGTGPSSATAASTPTTTSCAGGTTEMSDPTTPSALGYRHPAEWEPHAATWLAWPHQEEDWPGKLSAVAWAYTEMIRKLTRHERV